MTLEQVWAVIVTAVITGLVGFVFGFLKDASKERKADQEKREQQLEALIESNREVLAQLQALQEKYDTLNDEVKDLKQKLMHRQEAAENRNEADCGIYKDECWHKGSSDE